MTKVKITVGTDGDPSVGINGNEWELIIPIEDALDNSYSRQPLEDIKTSERLSDLMLALGEFFTVWSEHADYVNYEVMADPPKETQSDQQ